MTHTKHGRTTSVFSPFTLFITLSTFCLKKCKVKAIYLSCSLFPSLYIPISCCLVSLCSVLQRSPLPGFSPPAKGDASCGYYPRYSEKFPPAGWWGQAFLCWSCPLVNNRSLQTPLFMLWTPTPKQKEGREGNDLHKRFYFGQDLEWL